MENRFGIKDLFLFLLVSALIVLVAWAMVMFDRQYKQVLVIKQQNEDLTRDVSRIRSQLSQGVVSLGSNGGATTRPAGPDAFNGLREAEAKPDFARGDWLIDNFGTKVGKLTPLTSTDIYQSWVERQVLEPLADRDVNTLEYLPRLAERWDISKDGLTITFHLRRGVEFSDGTPLTADDVVFTFDWVRNPSVSADRPRAYLTKLTSVKKVDDYTVEFTFNEFYYLNFDTVANSLGIMPKHFYSKYTPDQFNEKTGLLMGSGPYKLEDPANWTPGQPVLLVRNERFWGMPGTFDRIRFNELQGEAAEMVVYGNQEQDLIRCMPEQFNKLTADPRIMSFSNKFEYDNMYGGYVYIGWNQLLKNEGKEEPTPFADKRVRQAMTLLLDRERIKKDVYLGYGTVVSGPFAPNGPQSDPTVKPWPHDEAKGKALLAEAGFADRNKDGVIEDAKGVPFRFKLTYPSGNESTEKVVLLVKDNFARAGIVMEPDRVDWPVLIQKLTQSNFQAVTLGWSSVPESDPYQIFHSSQIAGQGDNRTAYRSEAVDKAIDAARTTVDVNERMKRWHEVHRILHEDQPYTFLLARKSLRLFNKRIQNIEPAKIGINFEYLHGGMIPWYVPQNQQKYTR